jgi:hypothetical protein
MKATSEKNDFDGNEELTEQSAPPPPTRKSFLDRLTDVVGLTNKPAPQSTPRPKAPELTTAEIDDEINPRLMKAVRMAVSAHPPVGLETFHSIGLATGFSVTLHYGNREVIDQLNELQAAYETVMSQAMSYVPRHAAEAYRAFLADAEKTAIETSGVSQATGRTLEDFTLEFKHKFDVAIAASKTFAPRARELVRPHIDEYIQQVRALADKMALSEIRWHDFLKLKWIPSSAVVCLYKAADTIEQYHRTNAGHDPKSVAAFIDLEFEKHWHVIEHLTFTKPGEGDPQQATE